MVNFKYGDPQTIKLANNGQNISFQRVGVDDGIQDASKIFFKGYFKTFEDTFTSHFEETITYGRMDPIMNFKRTGRKISVSFDVVAGDLAEAKNNLFKIQKLAQFLYPNYAEDNPSLIKNSPLFKVKMMNLIQDNGDMGGLLCTLSGFSYAPNFENGAFIEDKKMYSKSNTIQTTITPLHSKTPGWGMFSAEGADQFSRSFFPYGQGGSKKKSNWQESEEENRISDAQTSSKTSVNSSNVTTIKQKQVLEGGKANAAAAAKARGVLLAREREQTGETVQQQQNRLAQEAGVRGGTRTR